jgi:hypothetical protein
MASILISAAVNIAIGIAINALFPPDAIEQEGPRLTDLGFTSAAYGKFINITFGTDRISGNIIDVQDPAIEEVVTTETQDVGGKGIGGGQEVNTTTFTYFFTGRIAFSIEGAVDLIRIWADSKIIYDAGGPVGGGEIDPLTNLPAFRRLAAPQKKGNVTVTFYPGGETQLTDPEEVGRRGADIPAYRHLTSVKLDKLPLADFGNRIPNFTAEIAYASIKSEPFFAMTEPASLDPPGSTGGAVTNYMAIDPTRNLFFSLKSTASNNGVWSGNLADMTFKAFIRYTGFATPGVGLDGFAYGQNSGANATAMHKKDVETGETVATLGFDTSLTLVDEGTTFFNGGVWVALQVPIPGIGVKNLVFHFNTSFGNSNGSIVDADAMTIIHVFGTGDGLPANTFSGTAIPDNDRGRLFIMLKNTAGGTFDLWKVSTEFLVEVGGPQAGASAITLIHSFSHNGAGKDFEGAGAVTAWAMHRTTGDIMFSNDTDIVLYNPDTDTILATRHDIGFTSRYNYFSGSDFAFSNTNATTGIISIIDTRTLETKVTVDTDDIPWAGGDTVIHDSSAVWDDRTNALVLSRVDVGSAAPVDDRIIKLFLNRLAADGTSLDAVVSSLSTEYNRMPMAGLLPADIDVTTLAGESVRGYTVNRRGSVRQALEPLRQRFFFDGVQSDWKIKFPIRGGASVLTIPEEEIGELKRGRDQTDEPAIREIRQQDLELPMSIRARYRNKDIDYQVDMEQDKRQISPAPTMHSQSERTLDVPIVDIPVDMKQLAQKWLWTIWNERIAYKTVVPWTYLKLDPTDVFQMGVFGETARVRMSELDIGAGLSMDITAVVEDIKSFSSTLVGGANLGFVLNPIPSNLPTRLVPLDAPLLSLQDLLLTSISNAYIAFGAFEIGWPGGSSLKSRDGVQYATTATANAEMALARISVAPGAWPRVEEQFRNRFQEIVDGGTLTINPIRRAGVWASATELQVLNGANAIAVVRDSDKQVEIVQFQDVTINTDGTITLDRLLRGRLGTEDVTELGLSIGDTIVLLSDSAGVNEVDPIQRQRIALPELNISLFFKGVTVGTLIEDAGVQSFTYTGRDLKPFSPGHIAISSIIGGINVAWERRTRGPGAGEWEDGTGTVPMNELIEQYEVTLNTPSAGDFITKVVNNVRNVDFTAAELALGGASSSLPEQLVPKSPDGDFQTNILSGDWFEIDGTNDSWVSRTTHGAAGEMALGPPAASGGNAFLGFQKSNTAEVASNAAVDIDLIDDLGLNADEIANMSAFGNLWVAQERTNEDMQFFLKVLDQDKVELASGGTGIFAATVAGLGIAAQGDWAQVGSNSTTVFNSLPMAVNGVAGARFLRVQLQPRKHGTTFSTANIGMDVFQIEIVIPPQDMVVKVSQVSDTGLKSPVIPKTVT